MVRSFGVWHVELLFDRWELEERSAIALAGDEVLCRFGRMQPLRQHRAAEVRKCAPLYLVLGCQGILRITCLRRERRHTRTDLVELEGNCMIDGSNTHGRIHQRIRSIAIECAGQLSTGLRGIVMCAIARSRQKLFEPDGERQFSIHLHHSRHAVIGQILPVHRVRKRGARE